MCVCTYVTVRHIFGEHITEINGKHDIFKVKRRIKYDMEKTDEQKLIGQRHREFVKRQSGVDPEPPVAHSLCSSRVEGASEGIYRGWMNENMVLKVDRWGDGQSRSVQM